MQEQLTVEEIKSKAPLNPKLERLRSFFLKYSIPILIYIAALFIIYVGMWTIPAWRQVGNSFNEPIWLYHSLCLDAVSTAQYPESCRDLSLQSLDHSAGAKYLIGFVRWLKGIPPEAVKYLYHSGVPVPDHDLKMENGIREQAMDGVTLFSCLTLFAFFILMQRSFGSVTAFTALLIMVITPFWHLILNTIGAEPFTMLTSMLIWSGTLILARLLTARKSKPLPLIVLTAAISGAVLGYAIGIKPDGGIAGVGSAVVLLYLFIRHWRDWFLYVWVGATVFISALIVFILTNPLLWDADFLGRLKIYMTFRATLFFGFFGGKTLSPIESVPSALSSSFEQPFYTIFPPIIGLPLCLLGIWVGWQIYRSSVTRLSYLWILSVGIINSLLLPIQVNPGFNYYQLYTNFTTHLLIALGLGFGLEYTFGKLKLFSRKQTLLAPTQWALPSRNYSFFSRTVGITTAALAVLLLLVIAITFLSTSKERKLWQEYVMGPTWDKRYEQLNKLVELDPQARSWLQLQTGQHVPPTAGEPVIDELQNFFETYSRSGDTQFLSVTSRTGGLLRKYSQNKDLVSLVDYEMNKLNENFLMRVQTRVWASQFTNDTAKSLPAETQNPNEVLQDLNTPIRSSFELPYTGNFRLNVVGQNLSPAPISVEVRIDKSFVGTLTYYRGDNSFSTAFVAFNAEKGKHTVEFFLVKSPENTNRTARIKEFGLEPADPFRLCALSGSSNTNEPLQAKLCEEKTASITLNNQSSKVSVALEAPASTLYELRLQTSLTNSVSSQIDLVLDGKPLRRIETSAASSSNPPASEIRLPPVYLTQGPHTLTLQLVDMASEVKLEKLLVGPQFPAPTLFSPAELGSAEPNVATLNGNTSLHAPVRLFGYNYSFYDLYINGSTEGAQKVPLEVLVNDMVVGTVELDNSSIRPEPLKIELANGGDYQLTLRSTQNAKAYVYSVQLIRHTERDIIAGTQFSWAKEVNSKIHSIQSVVSLPKNIVLTRDLPANRRGYYDIVLRVRNPQPTETEVNLGIKTQDWFTARNSVKLNSAWTDISFKVYLDQGINNLKLSWDSSTDLSKLDIMYMKIGPLIP